MSKPNSIRIDIPNPCMQDWDHMEPTANGRFCDHCQTNVIDFTNWSDAMLYDFFSKQTGKVCGQYTSRQVGRPILMPHQPQSRLYRIVVGLGLVLIFTQSPEAQAKRAPFVIENVCSLADYGDDFEPQSGVGTISGFVRTPYDEPIAGAQIKLIFGGAVVAEAVTDSQGCYLFSENISAGYYDVSAYAPGYRLTTKTQVPGDANGHTRASFYLQKLSNASEPPIMEPFEEPHMIVKGMRLPPPPKPKPKTTK